MWIIEIQLPILFDSFSSSFRSWFVCGIFKMSLDLRNANQLLIIVIEFERVSLKIYLWLALPILFFLFLFFLWAFPTSLLRVFIYLFICLVSTENCTIFNLKTFTSSIILDCLRTHVQIHHIEVELHQYPRQIHFICR